MQSRTTSVNGSVNTPPVDSPWIRLDEWAAGSVGFQCVVTGTVVYSVQTTFDDPNDNTNPVATPTWDSLLTGVNNSAQSVSGTVSGVVPKYIKVHLASGSGTVTMTVIQALSVPF